MATSDARQPSLDASARAAGALSGRRTAAAAARDLLRLRDVLVTAALLSVVVPAMVGAALVAAGIGSRAGWSVAIGLGVLLPGQVRILSLLLPRRAGPDEPDAAIVVSLSD